MAGGFPSAPRSVRTAELGVNAVSSVVNDHWGWIFRRNHNEHDFGIDGYIDVVGEDGSVTGQCLAVQIKTGESYFSSQDALGVTFYGENKHLNYYSNCPMPVLVVLCDPATRNCLWAHFAPERTESTQTGWKMTIPKRNRLDASAKTQLLQILGPAENFLDALACHWIAGEALAESDFVLYAVDRAAIEALDVEAAVAFFDRLRSNEALARRLQGRVDLSVSGYHDDPRELWEIPEVRSWFSLADPAVRDWFFFLEARPSRSPLRMYVSCMCNTEWIEPSDERFPRANIDIDSREMAELFELNFLRLNELLEQLGMTIDDNKAITYGVFDVFDVPHEPWPT